MRSHLLQKGTVSGMKKEPMQLSGLTISSLQTEITNRQQNIGELNRAITEIHQQIRRRIRRGIDTTGDAVLDLIYLLGRIPEKNRRLTKHLRALLKALSEHPGEFVVLEEYQHASRYSTYLVDMLVPPADEGIPLSYQKGIGRGILVMNGLAKQARIRLYDHQTKALNERKEPCRFTLSDDSRPLESEKIH
jgi:hypothetical protein